jgi:drug/metabolite transporter (DMT)-like permease
VSRAIVFAILAGLGAATWTLCLKLASSRTSAVVGAIVITTGALAVNLTALLVMKVRGHETALPRESLWLLLGAGVAAASVDLFGLLAYQHGLRVTSSFVIGGTSTLAVLLAGFLLLQEPFTWGRLLAVALITAGILLYQGQGG